MLTNLITFCRGLTAPLNKPIFLVGCGKSGTTLLGSVLAFHPCLGPTHQSLTEETDLQAYLDALTELEVHGHIAHEMEDKDLWDRYFPIRQTDLRIGRELILESSPLSYLEEKMLIGELSKKLKKVRYCSKQPFNTFRIHALREIFPDCTILALHRDGRDVVSSWGREGNRWHAFGGYEAALPIFCRKWNEAIDHIESFKNEVGVKTFKFEDLVLNPASTIRSIFQACDVDWLPDRFAALKIENRIGVWKTRIPSPYHGRLHELLHPNLLRLGYEIG